MAKIFISYTRRRDADSRFANDLRSWLTQQGHAPWMDVYNIPAGANWDDEIDKALYAGDAVLGIVSSASVESDNVKNEWASAQDDERLELYLLRIEECEIPYRFYRMDYIDFTREPQAGWTRLQTTLSQRFPVQGVKPASDSRKAVKSRSCLRNPLVWIGVGFTSLLLVAAIVFAVVANAGNNRKTEENAEAFLTRFFSGDINGAVNYVCVEQEIPTRNVFNNAVLTLQLTNADVRAQNVSCTSDGGSQVQCTYTLIYTDGSTRFVDTQLRTRDNLVCDPFPSLF